MKYKNKIKTYVGTSGYHYSQWFDIFYKEKKDYLKQYSKHFNTVEINSTFYKIPTISSVKKWAESIKDNPNFVFSIKINQYITHYIKLNKAYQPLLNFFKPLRLIKDKLECILFQFHKNFKYTDKTYSRLTKLMLHETRLKEKGLINKKTKFVFEFRNETFYNEEIYKLFKLNKWVFVMWHGVGKLVNNSPVNKSISILNFFEKYLTSSNIIYLRLHGTKGLYYGKYSHEQLSSIANFIKENSHHYKKAFVYFNNVDVKDEGLQNSLELINKLEK